MPGMLRTLAITSAMLAVSSGAGATSSDSSAVEKAVRDANAGKPPLADCRQSGAVIDEFAPFAWDSFSSWADATGKYFTQNAITKSKMSHLKFRHVRVEGTRAYAVVSALYTYSQDNHPRSEQGLEAVALEKTGSGWCQVSFAWLGKTGVDGGADATAIGDVVAKFASMKPGDAPPPTAITDEFAPFAWQGASAAADWSAGLAKGNAADGDTDLAIGLSQPSQLDVDGTKAYAVYPTTLTYSHKGKSAKEDGTLVFALDKSSGTWRITSWAWATD